MTLRSMSRTCGGRQRAKGPLDRFATAYRVSALADSGTQGWDLPTEATSGCETRRVGLGEWIAPPLAEWAPAPRARGSADRRRIAARARGALYSAYSRGLPQYRRVRQGACASPLVRALHGVWGEPQKGCPPGPRSPSGRLGQRQGASDRLPSGNATRVVALAGDVVRRGRLPTKCCGGNRWSRASSRSNAPTTPTGG